MSDLLSELFPVEDIECTVGVVRNRNGGPAIPLFLCDYGKELPSFTEMMNRYKRITLDINPLGDGQYTFIIMSDKVVVELTSENIDRALTAKDARGMFSGLMKNGRPEFSVTYDVNEEGYALFSSARDASLGAWLLVILAADATELLVDNDGTIVSRNRRDRDVYDNRD